MSLERSHEKGLLVRVTQKVFPKLEIAILPVFGLELYPTRVLT